MTVTGVTPAQADLKAHLDLENLQEQLNPNAGSLATACKSVLETGRTRIHECYLQGASAAALLELQTQLTDTVLLHVWQQFINENDNGLLSLLAVGGYGRSELHPYSDIDIAILVDPHLESDTEERLSQFVTALWDLGVAIGHSVRTVAECQAQARDDATIITNLMEARYMAGAAPLFHSMLNAISPHQIWPANAYFDAKIREQANRRQKYLGDAYRLEPNLKQSNGGMRDIQTLFWVTQRVFGTRRWDDLVTQGLLTEQEFETLTNGLEFLWKVRYLLHHFAKRAEDRLLFDHQREIAHEFGFTDDYQNRSIEQFMQIYFRNVTELQRLNEIMLQGIGGIISGVTANSKPVPINERFQLRNGFLEVTHDRVFSENPTAMLEVFIVFSNLPDANKLRTNTVRLLLSHLHLVDDNFRRDPVAQNLFLQIFRNPLKLTRCIRMMSAYGVLAAYLPAFATITGRMQYDLFHIYTVDEHTTRVIRNLRRFALEDHVDEMAHCSHVMQQVKQPYLLYLAALFHDIAKGRGGDHSELGAEDAMTFCQQHQLPPADAELVAWIVRYHLLMSMTAQRKDISDPDVVLEFANVVQTPERLNCLYLLTVSDIRGTNPELWNSFKENLLLDLYQSTAALLKRGLDATVDPQDALEQKQESAMALLESNPAAPALWAQFSDYYFQHHRAGEIAEQTQAILSHLDGAATVEKPLVCLLQNEERGATELLIYVQDHNALFALITLTLSHLNLNILSAAITTTSNGFALDSFYVLENDDARITEAVRSKQITDRLTDALSTPDDLPDIPQHKMPRRLENFKLTPKVEFDNTDSMEFTSVYVEALDQPGILSNIALGFMQSGTQVHSAKIATFGEKIEDTFLVSNSQGEKITSTKEQTSLREELIRRLDNDSDD